MNFKVKSEKQLNYKIMAIKFKEIFYTIAFAALSLMVGFGVYLLLMLFFAWMASWWWVFIVLFGLVGIASIIGVGQIIGYIMIPLSKNWLGRVLAIMVTIRLLTFSIHAVWTTDFISDNAKEITIKVIATIVFIGTYLPLSFAVFDSKYSKTNND